MPGNSIFYGNHIHLNVNIGSGDGMDGAHVGHRLRTLISEAVSSLQSHPVSPSRLSLLHALSKPLLHHQP
jgi:hypothetical protein